MACPLTGIWPGLIKKQAQKCLQTKFPLGPEPGPIHFSSDPCQMSLFFCKNLQARLDRGRRLPPPNGILINGRGSNGVSFTVDQGSYLSNQERLSKILREKKCISCSFFY